MARDLRFGMIQPRPGTLRRDGEPALFDLGCVGRIAEIEALDEGRYNLVLRGVSRFRIVRELEVTTPFRQVEAELLESGAEEVEILALGQRAALALAQRRFGDTQGFAVAWEAENGRTTGRERGGQNVGR